MAKHYSQFIAHPLTCHWPASFSSPHHRSPHRCPDCFVSPFAFALGPCLVRSPMQQVLLFCVSVVYPPNGNRTAVNSIWGCSTVPHYSHTHPFHWKWEIKRFVPGTTMHTSDLVPRTIFQCGGYWSPFRLELPNPHFQDTAVPPWRGLDGTIRPHMDPQSELQDFVVDLVMNWGSRIGGYSILGDRIHHYQSSNNPITRIYI